MGVTWTDLSEPMVGRCKDRRKMANNTYCYRKPVSEFPEEDVFEIVLHSTTILRYDGYGNIEINAGGWQTTTTQRRINEYLPCGWHVYSYKGCWYLTRGRMYERPVLFYNGITLQSSGREAPAKEFSLEPDPNAPERIRRAIRKHVDLAIHSFTKDSGLYSYHVYDPWLSNGDNNFSIGPAELHMTMLQLGKRKKSVLTVYLAFTEFRQDSDIMPKLFPARAHKAMLRMIALGMINAEDVRKAMTRVLYNQFGV